MMGGICEGEERSDEPKGASAEKTSSWNVLFGSYLEERGNVVLVVASLQP